MFFRSIAHVDELTQTPRHIDSPATTPARAAPSRRALPLRRTKATQEEEKTTEEGAEPVLPRDESRVVAVPAAQTSQAASLRQIIGNISDPDDFPASDCLVDVEPTPFPEEPTELALGTSDDHDEAARKLNEDREAGRKRGKEAGPKFQECYGLVRDSVARLKSLDEDEVSCIIFYSFWP